MRGKEDHRNLIPAKSVHRLMTHEPDGLELVRRLPAPSRSEQAAQPAPSLQQHLAPGQCGLELGNHPERPVFVNRFPDAEVRGCLCS